MTSAVSAGQFHFPVHWFHSSVGGSSRPVIAINLGVYLQLSSFHSTLLKLALAVEQCV